LLLINLPIRVVLIFSSISSVPKANVLYLIYDGECPVCSKAAQILRIRKSVGKLEIINARTKHLLVEKAKKEG
jgi:predicted DCC family thiol-disulfide oxidoreductase YuxK